MVAHDLAFCRRRAGASSTYARRGRERLADEDRATVGPTWCGLAPILLGLMTRVAARSPHSPARAAVSRRVTARVTTTVTPPFSVSGMRTLERVVRAVAPSVVQIRTPQDLGSGVVSDVASSADATARPE